MKSKQSIRILIALMTIALVGVILIQFLWIRNAMLLKQEQFDRSVNAALVRVSADLENKYGVHFITEKLQTDSSARKEVLTQDPGFYKFMISVDDSKEDGELAPGEMGPPGEESVLSFSSNCSNGDGLPSNSQNIEVRTGNGKRHVVAMVNVNNNGNQQVVIQKSVLRDPPAPPAPPVPPGPAPSACQLIQIVRNVADEYAMSKMSSKDVGEVIDSPKIFSAIKKEFSKQGLPLNFEFATYCVEGDSLMINKSSSNDPLKDYTYKSPLLATDFIEAGSLLLVNFPAHYRYLFGEVADMLLLSLFFTIAIISAFAYSLHVIFKQKKVSEITNDFINNMTHELKTPLATISLTADTLGLETVNHNAEMVSEYSGMIKNEVGKLSRHVDRILEAAVLERNGTDGEVERVSVSELVQEEFKVFEPLIHQKNGQIDITLPERPVVIAGNKDQVRGMICNLIDNAVKYSGAEPIIKVSLTRNAVNTVLLCVSDNGIGISKADQRLIFDKFYRAHTGNRHDVKGFGLGLNFVKSVAECLHGRVWVESEEGKGSRFYVEFPEI